MHLVGFIISIYHDARSPEGHKLHLPNVFIRQHDVAWLQLVLPSTTYLEARTRFSTDSDSFTVLIINPTQHFISLPILTSK